MRRRLVIIGWDGVPPELPFEKLRESLPTVNRLMARGLWGNLRSCDPPITVPAWMVMMTGQTPSQLGVFGFRRRAASSYTDIHLVSSNDFQAPALWDFVESHGGESCLFGLPPMYPPKSIRGAVVSCHLTPDHTSRYTHPAELQQELEQAAGPYLPDVVFRSGERDRVKTQLLDMVEQHRKMEEHLFGKRRWDLFVSVEIATDRVHHAFWKFTDPAHPKYTPHPSYSQVMRDLYAAMDARLSRMLSRMDDDTCLLLVSDHGAKAMQGCFCLNEWLIQQGYLVLKEPAAQVMKLEQARVDWERTSVWGWGGYYARIFFNVKGREPQGVLDLKEAERLKTKVIQELEGVRMPNGEPLGVEVLPASEQGTNGSATSGNGHSSPDLMLYFGNLDFRSAGTIGHGRIFLDENDTGPDDAVHSREGIFLFYDPKRTFGRRVGDVRLVDIAPTCLKLLGQPQRSQMTGSPLEAAG